VVRMKVQPWLRPLPWYKKLWRILSCFFSPLREARVLDYLIEDLEYWVEKIRQNGDSSVNAYTKMEKPSILIFCKKCERVVGRLPMSATIPYSFTCPYCGTRDKLRFRKRWKSPLTRLPKLVATNSRSQFAEELRKRFQIDRELEV